MFIFIFILLNFAKLILGFFPCCNCPPPFQSCPSSSQVGYQNQNYQAPIMPNMNLQPPMPMQFIMPKAFGIENTGISPINFSSKYDGESQTEYPNNYEAANLESYYTTLQPETEYNVIPPPPVFEENYAFHARQVCTVPKDEYVIPSTITPRPNYITSPRKLLVGYVSQRQIPQVGYAKTPFGLFHHDDPPPFDESRESREKLRIKESKGTDSTELSEDGCYTNVNGHRCCNSDLENTIIKTYGCLMEYEEYRNCSRGEC